MQARSEDSQQQRRILWIGAVFAGVGLLLVARLIWWQLLPHEEIRIFTTGQRLNTIPSIRGSILDAGGQYLSVSTAEYTVGISPRLIDITPPLKGQNKDDVFTITSTMTSLLNLDAISVTQILEQRHAPYLELAKNKPLWFGQEFERLPTGAFRVDMTYRRLYPEGSLAGSVLGFIHREHGAQYGIEEYYNRELQGLGGRWQGVSGSWGEQIMMTLGGYQAAQDGTDLVLTLDRNIQAMAEAVLYEGMVENKAAGGNLIVLDPRSGAILAMANLPNYMPGDYGKVQSADQYINTAVSAIYEPGSVFKPLTLAAALETRVIRPTDSYDDRGEIMVGQQRIRNSDRQAHGPTTMTQLLAYSRNVGAAHVATLLGPTRFYEVIRRFGFGETSGVDLAREVPGVMRVPGNRFWHMSDLGTNSFGQGISVTPLQVVAAYGALANGGVLMRPYIVSELRRGDISTTARQPFRVRRVISADTSQQITKLMVDGVDLGLKKATLPGYRIAGKSGTSEIPDQEGYRQRDFIASFIGFGPVPNPRFVVLVKYDKPQESYWGGDAAAPAFRKMAKWLLDYYGIPPSTGG
jgi:cell division protein FtsI/penicillin-binding protein 2